MKNYMKMIDFGPKTTEMSWLELCHTGRVTPFTMLFRTEAGENGSAKIPADGFGQKTGGNNFDCPVTQL